MMFDLFKKFKKKDEPRVSEKEINRSIADYVASSITVGPAETEATIPDYQGDYSKAVFLWANSRRCQIRDKNDYPRYILYECGIKNAPEYHRELIEQGYLQADGFEASLESLKLTELKEIASDLGVTLSGKKADIAKRIVSSENAAYLRRQMPSAYSLSEMGKTFVEQNDDCVQIHRHKTWMIDWKEYEATKRRNANGTFYSVCTEILLRRASVDKHSFGRNEYLNLSKLEEEFGDPRRSLRYLLQVLYIDVSGILGYEQYNYYKQGIYDKKVLKEMFISNVMIAPGVINRIEASKRFYESGIIDRLYTWKLPIEICEKALFEDIVNSILDGNFDIQFYSEQLKTRYETFVNQM